MADTIVIEADARDRAGKGAARATRRAGMIPGVIYGDKKPPLSISIESLKLGLLFRDPAFASHLYDIKLEGDTHRALARDVQYDPVTDGIVHVDFLRVSARTTITIEVPTEFINEEESPGLRRGGVVNVVRHAVELVCRADSIPEKLVFDLTGLDIGDSIHISAIELPSGVRPAITDRDFTVATIAAPSVVRDEAEEAAAEAAAEAGEEVEGEEGEEGEAEERSEG
ncbi:MAG: 50S ribosomal protein L25/general stress protein Ctc [Inquilinus sp.]|nr:50S ribosomal protein L25/general stress protein Ctc [Inquilinus sp.]